MHKKGFTLIEILVVVAIIGVLSTIGLITYSGTQAKARDAIRKADLQKLALVLEGYFQKNGKYVPPQDTTGADSCQRDTEKFYQDIATFFQGDVPKDPKDGESYCYIAVDGGTGFRLFSKLESCQEEGAISGIDCEQITYRYSLVSEDLTVEPSFDDVVAVGEPGTVNLLANAGFENGFSSWTSWRFEGGSGSLVINDTLAHSGNKAASLDYGQICRFQCTQLGSLVEGVYLAQTFARNVQPGQTFNISFWTRSGEISSVNAHVYVTERGRLDQESQLTQMVSFFHVGPTWSQFSGTFTVPSDWAGKDLQIVLVESDTRGGVSVLFDDVVVTQGVPTSPPPHAPSPSPSPSPSPTPSPVPAMIAVVDSSGIVGRFTSIIIGTDNLPVISYYDDTTGNFDLKVVKCGNAACSSGNTISVVDSGGLSAGWNSSIAIGTDGNPVISYNKIVTAGDKKLMMAKCSDPACSTATTTVVDTVTFGSGSDTSIAIGTDGNPVISYYDSTNRGIKVVKCGNDACSSGNSIIFADQGNVDGNNSLAIGSDGKPVISYNYISPDNLKVVKCGNDACSSGNSITTLDSSDTADGEYNSIAIGSDGKPIISYYAFYGKLKVVKCGNASCSSGNSITVVEEYPSYSGWHTSITIGSDGNPMISYHDEITDDLKVVKCGNDACSSGNSITIIDTIADVGEENDIAIGSDGKPIISYYDKTNGNLKVAKCVNADCR